MPRQSARDEDAPRRRRAKAAAVEIETERNLAMRILLHSPKDVFAGLVAFAAASAIIGNALFLQTGRHPAPMFGTVVVLPAQASVALPSPLPRPRPLAADTLPLEPRPMEFRVPEPKLAERAPEPAVTRSADPMTNLVKQATAAPPAPSATVARPPAAIPGPPSHAMRRIAAVQRALSEYGYGQLKATGVNNAETQAAIAKFEREHRMPVTGQVSDRLLHDLAAAIGHPVE